MKALRGACIIGQSGGPTAVINASAYGVIHTALSMPEITAVYGAAHGIKGVIEDRLYDMRQEDPEELRLLLNTPSSELGSCRYKLADPDKDDKDYRRILEVFKKYNVRYFFYNGGNDSMDTCAKISRYMQKVGYECRVIGVPKTIDNDLFGTDHCPGFGSAAKYIATSVMEVYKDARVYDTGTIAIIEIMGRHAGWLAGSAALGNRFGAGPDLVYLPEVDFSMEAFLADIKDIYARNGKCLVAVSEGIHYADGSFVSEAKTSATDGFGHAQLGGLAALLADVVKRETGVKVRGIELNLLQRCAAHLASQTDIDEAFLAGKAAVEAAVSGETGKMVAFVRTNGQGAYGCRVEMLPLDQVANLEKKVPREWINAQGNGVTDAFLDYVFPLIQGEPQRTLEHSLPRFARLKKMPPDIEKLEIRIGENSIRDMCARLTHLAGKEPQYHDGFVTFDSGKGAIYSRHMLTPDAKGRDEEVSKAIMDLIAQNGPRYVSYCRELVGEGYDEVFRKLGFTNFMTQTGMYLDLKTYDFTANLDPVVRIDRRMLEPWIEALDKAFPKPSEADALSLFIDDEECAFFAYMDDGKILGTAIAYCHEDICGMHEVGTLPEYQRNGVCRALLEKCMRFGLEKGCRWASLQSNEAGYPAYTAIGFTPVGTLQSWILPK